MSKRLPLIGCILAATMLAGCGSDPTDDELVPYVERPVGAIYNEAAQELDERNYRLAAALFNEVERQHPYSAWATKAKLMSAYAHYQGLRYEDAIASLDRFIQLHPGNEDIAYAYYLRALCYYEQISDIRRDQSMTESALDNLSEVVRRFPGTPYAADSQVKIDLTRDHLAGKSMEIGRYYLSRGQYNAAINRFQEIVREYDTTSHTPEALHRLTEAYLAIGLMEEARKAAATLGYNHPNSRWYEDSYALLGGGRQLAGSQRGFFSRAWDSLF